MGEALREAPSVYVNTYVAAQAAVPAHMYDPKLPSRLVDDSVWSITTPDVFRHYPHGNESEPVYFDGFLNKTKNRIINYFNQEDYALNFWWRNTEMTRPDWLSKPYHIYAEGDGNVDTYNASAGDKFGIVDNLKTLTLPEDTFEIFSFAVQSRSWALGTIGKTDRVNNFGDHVDLETMGFDNTHYSHSKEFRSNLPNMLRFWKQLRKDFALDVIHQGWDQ